MLKRIFLLLLPAYFSLAQPNATGFKPVHKAVLEKIYELDLKGVEKIYSERKNELQGSAITYLLENYYDFLVLQLKDENTLFKELKKSKNNRIGAIQKSGSSIDWIDYCQAQVHLQWGLIRLKMEYYSRGIWDTRLAFNQFEEADKLRPDFLPNQMSFGLLNIMIGATPHDKGKWIKLIGIHGDFKKGMILLRNSKSRKNPFWYEASLLEAYVHGYIMNREESGYEILQELNKSKSTLLGDLVTSIYLMKIRKNQEAIALINKRIDQCPKEVNPHFHFLLGEAYLRKGLYKEAVLHLKHFLFHFKGMTNRKEANYKVALAYYLDGNLEKADEYWVRTAQLGYTFVSSDNYAQKQFEGGKYPNKTLQKARLFFDGGYYEDAISELKKFSQSGPVPKRLASEFYYRLGRIKQAQDNSTEAIKNFEKCIISQGKEQWYFAPMAYLQMGYMEMDAGSKEKARSEFEKAKSYPKNPYQESIDSKAKIALLLLEDPSILNESGR